MANEKTIAKKQAQVDELAKVLKDAKVVLLTDYRGITVTDVTKLRADLRNANAEYKVIKNNIICKRRISIRRSFRRTSSISNWKRRLLRTI